MDLLDKLTEILNHDDMNNNVKNIAIYQLDNADNFIVPKIKKFFLKLCVIVFSSYSLFLFKKLRRIKMI